MYKDLGKIFDTSVVYYYDEKSMNYFVKNKDNKFILVSSSKMKKKLKDISSSIFDIHEYDTDESNYVVEKNFVKSQRDKIKNNDDLNEDDEYIVINDIKDNKEDEPMIKGWFTKLNKISFTSSLINKFMSINK